MRVIIIIILFFFQSFANASSKNNIINNFRNINNLQFLFSQKINKKIENGKCIIAYPKKIYCKYNNFYNKILVSNGKSLVINSDKNKQYIKYKLEKTPLNLILDKDFIIKKIKESNIEKELDNSHTFEFHYKDSSIILFFDKYEFNLMGWTTTDIYQNKVETKITNIKTNINFDENIFKIRNYTN
tara:strand:+ start:392 stop:946 length:555 start_codon:yes stop_codon:yes gene_type:complete